jgi:hypothetical protein
MLFIGKILLFSIRFLCFVPAIYGVRHFTKLTPTLKAFTLLMCLSSICEIISSYIARYYRSNTVIDHVYVPIQAVLMCYAFSFHLTPFIKPSRLMYIGILFAIFSVFNSFFIQPWYVMNSYAIGPGTTLNILLILGFFLALVQSEDTRPFSQIPEVWICSFWLIHLSSAFVWYAAGSLFLLLPLVLDSIISSIRSYLLLTFYLSIAYGIWIHRKQLT